MNQNNLVFYEKYLKYKAKYFKLKELEEKYGGGLLDDAKKKIQSITGTTPQDNFNSKVLAILDKQFADASKKVNNIISSLESEQQKQVRITYEKEFSNSIVFGTGPIATAIKGIRDVFDKDGKELRKTTPDDEFKKIMQKFHNSDTVEPVVLKMASENIKNIYNYISKLVDSSTSSKFPLGSDDISTVNSIVEINKQLNLDKLCKAQGLATGVSVCTKEKVDAFVYILKELDNLEKAVEKANKILKESEDSRKKAQNAINVVATANGISGDATFETASKAVLDKLTVNKNDLVKSIGLTVSGEVNKENIIKAMASSNIVSIPKTK